MALNAERLYDAREDIANAVNAIQSGDTIKVSDVGLRLLREVRNLDDDAWRKLTENLDDDGLQQQLLTIRNDTSQIEIMGPPTRLAMVGHKTSFDVADESLMVDLGFKKAGDESWFKTSQDLEDTLWVGASVVKVVARVLERIQATLRSGAQQNCLGQAFEKNLRDVEDAVTEVRRRYQAIGGADRGHQDDP